MTAYDELRTPYRRWALSFTVSGLPIRYNNIVSPPSTTVHRTGRQYVDRLMLKDVSGVSDSYNIEGGVAEHAAHTITLATGGRFAADEYDPGVVFGRLTNRSAQYSARVVSDMTQSSVTQIEVDVDNTGLSMPRLIHIDGESIWVTGASVVTPGSVWRFTGAVRGAARSPQQPHTVDETFQDFPEVTTEVVHWRTRWATVYAAPIRDDGTVGDWVELIHGFIDTTPRVDVGGNTVTIQLAPMTALLDNELAPPQGATTTTRLLRGYHEFHWPEASTVEHMQYIPRGALSFSGGNAVSVAGLIPHVGANNEPWNNAHDFTLVTNNHPRKGTLDAGGVAGEQSISGVLAATDYIALDMPAGVAVNQVYSVLEKELYQKDLATALPGSSSVLQWPDETFGLINAAATGWTDTTVVGATGSWLSVKLDPSRSKIACAKNFTGFTPDVWFSFQPDPSSYFDGIDEPLNWRTTPSRESALLKDRLTYPLKFTEAPQGENGRIDVPVPGNTRDIPIVYPDAFYQAGERYILTEEDLDIPAAGVLNLRLKYRPVSVSGTAGDEKAVQFRAISSTAVSHGGSTVGYRLEIHPDDVDIVPSFGEWPGADSPELNAVATWTGASSASVMVQLLTSSGGNGINGPEDVLPFGAELPGSVTPTYSAWGAAEFVDINSFFNYPGPASVEDWTLFYEGGETIRDVIDSIARATSTLVTMQRRSDNTCRLRRVPVSASGDYESVGAIEQGDWLANSTPRYDSDDRVISRHVYKINHNEFGEAQTPVVIIDERALRTHREAKTYELDIRGLKLEDSGGDAPLLALRPLYSRISRILGDERRTWHGEVPTADAVLMQLGGVYTVTSRHLKGYDDDLGITAKTGRLKSLAFNFTTEGAQLEFVHLDQNATGWNAALQVTSVLSPTIVLVADNAFSGENNPSSGDLQSDVDFFAEGDTVRAVPTANHDAATVVVIDQINVNTPGVDWEVEFTGAHGLVAPALGTIEPAIYASAPDNHKELAYLADATPDLNGDPPQEIS